MVLSHTSGLPHSVRQGGPIQLEFEPGSRFAYSATGFTLLQRAVAQLTGQPIEAFMADRMFTPLGMTNSAFTWQERFANNCAAGYDHKGIRGATYLERFRNFTPEKRSAVLAKYPELAYPPAAAGLYTTSADYAKFLVRLLSPNTPAEMFDAQIKVDNSIAWAIGWGLLKSKRETWTWHWGNWNGLSQHFAAFNRASARGIVILTNSGNGLQFCLDYVPKILNLDLQPIRKLVL